MPTVKVLGHSNQWPTCQEQYQRINICTFILFYTNWIWPLHVCRQNAVLYIGLVYVHSIEGPLLLCLVPFSTCSSRYKSPTTPLNSTFSLHPTHSNLPRFDLLYYYYTSSSALNQSTPLLQCLPWLLLRTLPLSRVSLPPFPLPFRKDANDIYSFPRRWLRYHVNASRQLNPQLDKSYDLTRISPAGTWDLAP